MKRLCQIIMFVVVLTMPASAPYNLPVLRQQHIFDRSWIDSAACTAPCWENLAPGQTSYTDALPLIRHNTAFTIIPPPPHDASQNVTWASTIIVQRAQDGLSGDLWFDPTDAARPGALLTITLGVPKGTTLGDIIRWRGDPTRYALRCLNCFEAPELLYLHLYYDAQQMEVLTTVIRRPDTATWAIDWEQPILEVIYEEKRFYG
jgi:hypothetical protein